MHTTFESYERGQNAREFGHQAIGFESMLSLRLAMHVDVSNRNKRKEKRWD